MIELYAREYAVNVIFSSWFSRTFVVTWGITVTPLTVFKRVSPITFWGRATNLYFHFEVITNLIPVFCTCLSVCCLTCYRSHCNLEQWGRMSAVLWSLQEVSLLRRFSLFCSQFVCFYPTLLLEVNHPKCSRMSVAGLKRQFHKDSQVWRCPLLLHQNNCLDVVTYSM